MPPIASATPLRVARRAVARAAPSLRGRLPQRWHAGAYSALALCLLAAAPLADAWHPQYPPWAGTAGAACTVAALQPAAGGERAWDGVTSYRHAGLRLQLDFTDMPALQLFDAHDRALTAPVALGGAQMGFHGVEAVDLNGDRRPDFIVTLGSGGVGLAGGNAWRRVLLSDGSGYRSIEVETHEPTADDYRVLPHRAGCGLLQLVPVWGDASSTRDRKPHLFWVYRMLRFERGRAAYADAQLPGLPKWILYTARPHNSRASGLLGPAQKRQLWSAREHGRITPAPVDP
ncbi:hypothetical protein JR065_04210 [Xanthomonas sp. AmX2]|uniref:hypothetical protein n=1 Tax=Xanthomonas sp. TaxID=29446 RepID=UPI001980D14E|nr:hypothetical protein [Xanthomonas sp.]MBN6149532.1 hypothetical protein [Xanthomonas sp.]